MWHLTGTVLRSTDSMEDAIARLMTSEIKLETCDNPVFHTFICNQTKRGAEVVFIHTVKNCVFTNDSQVQWFPIDQLPENLVETERPVIDIIQRAFV